jgi:catechol 2,3-dioxygenase-like lactoylglutathione lyase family enzyme
LSLGFNPEKASMTLPLDHVVILVTDLEQTLADYSALGFNVQRGGTHADGYTHNALVGFADGSYLELIAFLKPKPDHRWGAWAAKGHEGFVDFALLPPAVGQVVERARAGGVAYQGPLDGGRTTLAGEVLKWQIGTPPSADLPFLCGDVTPRALRVKGGDVRVHANGVRGIAAITVLVKDLDASVERYAALLGAAAQVPAVGLAGLGLRQAAFALGPSTLVLVAAGPEAEHPAAATVRDTLAKRGEGVLGLSLRGSDPQALSRRRTHGAAIDVQRD